MKRMVIIAVMIAIVSGISLQAQAALQNLGTDSLGNRLIKQEHGFQGADQ